MAKHVIDGDTVAQAQALAHLGAWWIEPRARTVELSDEACRLFDLPPGADLTVEDLARIHGEDRDELLATLDRVAAGEPIERWFARHRGADGRTRWIEYAGGRDETGVLVGFVQDATDRRELRLRLEAMRARSELAESIADLGSWTLDLATGMLEWSPQVFRMVDMDPVGAPIPLEEANELLVPGDPERLVSHFRKVMEGEDVGPLSMRVPTKNGDVRWLELRAIGGGESRLMGAVQDVTERHLREDELALHARVLETLVEGVSLLRPADGIVLWANDRAAEQVGTPVEAVIGAPATDFFVPGQDDLLPRIAAEVERTGHWAGQVLLRRRDGTQFISQSRVSAMDHPVFGRVWLSVSLDDIARWARERDLRESESRLRMVQDNTPTGIASIAPGGRFAYVNDAACELFGCSRTELAEMRLQDLLHPHDAPDLLGLAAQLRAGAGTAQGERRFLRPDGSVVWALTTVSLVRDTEGREVMWIAHLLDITERRRQEDVLRRQALELAQANRAKSEFLSRMSHELRTPLNAVLGFAQLLRESDLEAEQARGVGQILTAGANLLGIIDDVLDISRLDSGTLDLEAVPVVVADAVAEAVAATGAHAAERGITVITDVDDAAVLGDRRRVVQVLANLIDNAIAYNRPHGEVTVRSATGPGGVSIAVADTGRGIPAEAIPRLFEPFARLGTERDGAEGTGIGLALCQGLVHGMGGTIAVGSTVGEGSTFTVTLPPAPPGSRPATVASAAEPAAEPAEEATAPPDTSTLRVVSIDDNPANQSLVRATLRRRPDVEVWSALTGAEGLALVDEHHPGLVLLDLRLPDVPGEEVLRRLRADPARPGPLVAVCSGDTDEERIEALHGLGADRYLTKPIDLGVLLSVVDEAAARQASADIDLT